MEGIVLLLVIFLILVIVSPIIALKKAAEARSEAKQTQGELLEAIIRIDRLEKEVKRLSVGADPGTPQTVLPARKQQESAPTPQPNPELEAVLERARKEELRIRTAEKISIPPPLPASDSRRKLIDYGDDSTPQPSVQQEPAEPFSWEKFMGVKLFAWLGGLAMFFGVIFFVKYAFENNLISPAMRITLGFVTGTALLVGGLMIHRLPRYKVLAQAFCATGVLILYGVSFAAHAIYHFPAFDTIRTFALMAGITFAAFLIAVRLNALVVAVLGMLGGFMTPVMLSTGQDQVLGLFGYIAMLDIGLLAVSRHGRWRFLTPCAAVGTALMQVGWFDRFFSIGHYHDGNRILIPMGILIGFIALFLAGSWIKRRRPTAHAAGSVLGLAAVAMLFAFVMLSYEDIARRQFLLYGFLLIAHLATIVTVLARPKFGMAQTIAAVLGFLHLACWTTYYLTNENLPGTLAIYLIFGALHAIAPAAANRFMPPGHAFVPQKSAPWFAPVALGMMLFPILRIEPVPMMVWAAILVADLIVIAIAATTRAILPLLVSLALTLGLAAVWLFEGPSGGGSLLPFLGLITGFAMLFAAAGQWLLRGGNETEGIDRTAASILPAASGALPFLLLLMVVERLPIPDPTSIFVVALLMSALLAALVISGRQGKLLLFALIGTAGVEAFWFFTQFDKSSPAIPFAWFVGFHLLFLILPFAFRRRCADLPETWIAAALSGVAHFLLVHPLVKQTFPNDFMGQVPAAFAVPALLGLYGVWKLFPEMDDRQQSRLAWFGGVALLFITLIFPIQFERQWITVSWAIEGALLLRLFRRVPHPGLQLTGLALLAIAFTRLTLNPAVFTAYERSGTAILNWHLYAYGAVAAAHFAGAKWFTDPQARLKEIPARGLLLTMGGILLFLLLNIEIADYFTAPGSRFVAFRFGGNFARDMTYSIAWGLFSLVLLGIGFRSGSKHARFAAVGLLVLTLVKVFVHDLAAIQNIFRIGALVGVAIIAFVASFLYQRFFDKPAE